MSEAQARPLVRFALLGAPLALAFACLAAVQAGSETPLAATLPLPHVELRWVDNTLHLSGTLPDEAERTAVRRHVQRLYAGHAVHDRLQLGEVANPSWLRAAFLPDLRATRWARAELARAELVIEGVAADPEVQRSVLRSAAPAREAGVVVLSQLQTAGGR